MTERNIGSFDRKQAAKLLRQSGIPSFYVASDTKLLETAIIMSQSLGDTISINNPAQEGQRKSPRVSKKAKEVRVYATQIQQENSDLIDSLSEEAKLQVNYNLEQLLKSRDRSRASLFSSLRRKGVIEDIYINKDGSFDKAGFTAQPRIAENPYLLAQADYLTDYRLSEKTMKKINKESQETITLAVRRKKKRDWSDILIMKPLRVAAAALLLHGGIAMLAGNTFAEGEKPNKGHELQIPNPNQGSSNQLEKAKTQKEQKEDKNQDNQSNNEDKQQDMNQGENPSDKKDKNRKPDKNPTVSPTPTNCNPNDLSGRLLYSGNHLSGDPVVGLFNNAAQNPACPDDIFVHGYESPHLVPEGPGWLESQRRFFSRRITIPQGATGFRVKIDVPDSKQCFLQVDATRLEEGPEPPYIQGIDMIDYVFVDNTEVCKAPPAQTPEPTKTPTQPPSVSQPSPTPTPVTVVEAPPAPTPSVPPPETPQPPTRLPRSGGSPAGMMGFLEVFAGSLILVGDRLRRRSHN